MFGVRSLLVNEKGLLMKKTWPMCIISTTDAAITVVQSLIRSDRCVNKRLNKCGRYVEK